MAGRDIKLRFGAGGVLTRLCPREEGIFLLCFFYWRVFCFIGYCFIVFFCAVLFIVMGYIGQREQSNLFRRIYTINYLLWRGKSNCVGICIKGVNVANSR